MLRKSGFKSDKITDALVPAAITSTTSATVVDVSGYQKALFIVEFGAEGDTLSGSLYTTVTVTTSDATGGTFANVAAADIDAAQTVTSGVLCVVDIAAEAGKYYAFAYTGKNDFVKVTFTLTGTHTNGTIVGVKVIETAGDGESFPITNT